MCCYILFKRSTVYYCNICIYIYLKRNANSITQIQQKYNKSTFAKFNENWWYKYNYLSFQPPYLTNLMFNNSYKSQYLILMEFELANKNMQCIFRNVKNVLTKHCIYILSPKRDNTLYTQSIEQFEFPA